MFCWDDAKNETNIKKHGIGFAAAALLFEGLTVEVPDTRHTHETRINAFGYTTAACSSPATPRAAAGGT